MCDSVQRPQAALHSRPYRISQQMPYNRSDAEADFRSCVLKYAKCAEALTVAASLKYANQILSDDGIIEALQQSVRRLTILSCHDTQSFPLFFTSLHSVCRVVRRLVCHGTVSELCFGHCTLSSDVLKELLECAATSSRCSVNLGANDHPEADNPWTQEKCDNPDDSSVTGSQDNLSDLYDIALQPCDPDLLPTSSAVCCGCLTSSDSCQETGIRTLTVINFKSTSGSTDKVLCDVLPRLYRLKKLALIGLTEMKTRKSVYLCRASQCVCTLIQSGQLSHVILDGCWLPPDFLSMLLSALLRRCRRCPLSELGLHFIDTCRVQLLGQVRRELTRGSFSGCTSLDISDNMFVDEDKLLPLWIRHDTALRRLNISCLDHKEVVPSILDAVAGHSFLQSLNLSKVLITQQLESQLIDVLRHVSTLEQLNLSDCCLSQAFVMSGEFITSVTSHQCLTDLNVAHNNLETAGVTLLTAICCSNSTTEFRHLDLSHNKIDGETLLSASAEITQRQQRHLVKLDLTFNFICEHVQQEIQRRYRRIAKSVVAPSLFPNAD